MSPIDLNNIGNWIEKLNQMKVCDQDCRNQKQIDQRRKDFYDAKRIHETSEQNMINAQEKYIQSIHTEDEYLLEYKKENEKKAMQILSKEESKKNKYLSEIQKKIHYNKRGVLFNKALNDKLYNNYDNEKNIIHQKMNESEDENNINQRLTTFYNEKIDYFGSINNILFYAHYIILLIIIVITIYKKQYGNLKLLSYLLLLILLPFLIDNYYNGILKSLKHTIIDNIYIILFISFITLTFVINYGANNIFLEQTT
jgi:hypothetical protein